MGNPIEVVLQFERLINSRDPKAVCEHLTPDSVFIDSLGNRVEGAMKMLPAWEGYFKMVPDYAISHSEIFANGNVVALFGTANGTLAQEGKLSKDDFWQTPAAWCAIVRDGKIALWQVFADNEPIRAIMRKHQ